MYPEFCIAQKPNQALPQHSIAQSYNPQVHDMPRARQPNENPKDYIFSVYTNICLVFDANPFTSIYRLDPFAKYLCGWKTEAGLDEMTPIFERTKWKHPNLISFLFIEELTDKYQFEYQRGIKIFYEYMQLDIRQLIMKRASNKSLVPEEELMKMLQGLCSALVFLQKKGISHQSLSLESVYFDEEYLNYRIQDVSVFKSKAPQLFQNQFHAPDQTVKPNKFKQDVFSLGYDCKFIQILSRMIMLCLSSLSECKHCYSGTQLDRQLLDSQLELLRKVYSGSFVDTIQSMLEFDIVKRQDWLELQTVLSQKKCTRSSSQAALQSINVNKRKSCESDSKGKSPNEEEEVKNDQIHLKDIVGQYQRTIKAQLNSPINEEALGFN